MQSELLAKIRGLLSSGMRQRVTRAGVGFAATIAVVGVLAVVTGNNLMFVILAFLLAAMLASGFLNRLSIAGLELDFVFPEHVPARSPVAARMKLHNEKSWMPSFSIGVSGAPGSVYSSTLYFPMLPPNTTIEEPVEVRFAKRGPHRQNSFRIHSAFPFGFAERQVQVTLRREVLVYPCLDPQPGFEPLLRELEGEIQALARGQGTDFYRIRPYAAQESAHHVDWKASAHTGELQVREFTREQEPLVEIFLDLNAEESERAWFERAVECCAFLSWEVTARGARLQFRTQEYDLRVPVEGDVYTILKYLAQVEPQRIRQTVARGRDESIAVVLSANPARLAGSGWQDAHIVGLDGVSSGPDAGAGSGRQAGSA